MKPALIALVALAAGFAIGRATATASTETMSPSSQSPAPSPDAPVDAVPRMAPSVAPVNAAVVPPSSTARAVVPSTDAAACEAKLREAERALAEAKDAGATSPSPWPDKIDDQWREDHMRRAVQAALQQLGGGDVTSTDCAEYPCIVWAKANLTCSTQDGSGASLRKSLMGTSALGGYHGLTMAWSPSPTGTGCDLAVYSGDVSDAVEARTAWRQEGMWKSIREERDAIQREAKGR